MREGEFPNTFAHTPAVPAQATAITIIAHLHSNLSKAYWKKCCDGENQKRRLTLPRMVKSSSDAESPEKLSSESSFSVDPYIKSNPKLSFGTENSPRPGIFTPLLFLISSGFFASSSNFCADSTGALFVTDGAGAKGVCSKANAAAELTAQTTNAPEMNANPFRIAAKLLGT